MDLSTLSNEELIRALADTPASGSAPAAAPVSDLQSMSDDDLLAALKQQPPELDAGRVGGLGLRAGVQAAPSIPAGLPALAYDGTIGFLENMTRQAYNAGARALGAEEVPYRDPFKMTNAVSGLGTAAADALNLPQPETAGERVAVGALQTGIEALGGAGLARTLAPKAVGTTAEVLTDLAAAPVAQGAVGALAGGGAQTAVENDVNPLIGMGAGMLLGAGTIAVGPSARQGFQNGRAAVNRTLARGDDVQQQLATDRFRAAASDPEAALRELDEGAGAELVPGSQPTTFQATGDLGLGALEREAQTANPAAFTARREAQNAARLDSVNALQGEGVSTDLVGFLRTQLQDIDNMTGAAETSARSQAQAAADAFRPADNAEGVGRNIRGPMRDAETAARSRESALWDAIDPEGSLQAVAPKTAVANVYADLTQSAQLGVSPVERGIVDLVEQLDNTVSFRELTDLRQQITQAMREELKDKGRTQSYRRLTQLNNAVSHSIENTAFNELSTNPAAAGRAQAYFDEWSPGPQRDSDTGGEAARSVRQGGFPGVAGTAPEAGRGSGTLADAPRVPGQTGRTKKGLSLTQFIARNGGLPLDAESTARDWGNTVVPGFGKLARPNGRPIDGYWRNKLIDAGYLPKDADGYSSRDITNELFDLIEQERGGRSARTAQDELTGAAPELDEQSQALADAARLVREAAADAGVRPEEMTRQIIDDAAEMFDRGDVSDPLTAYERAAMNADAAPERPPLPVNTAPSSGLNIFDMFQDDSGAGARYRAAADATKERARTFGSGAAGAVLRQGADRQTPRMSDASVAANAFRPGPTGAERIRELVAAGASPESIGEAAALTLGRHVRDGILDPRGFAQWQRQHAEALAQLPETVQRQFRDAAAASEALNVTAGLRRAALREFERSTLGKVANIDTGDLPNVIRGILNSQDAAGRTAELVRATRSDPTARAALKRAYAEHIERQFISNKEVGTSGENALKADQFASFIKGKQAALRQVFSGPELVQMRAIVDDIKRAERSLYANRTPGQSNTAQDMGSALDRAAAKANSGSIFTQILSAAGAGGFLANLPGAAAGVAGVLGARTLGAMRAAGMKRVDDLVLEMILDPTLGRMALAKAPLKPDAGVQRAFADRIMRLSPLATAGAVGSSE